VAVSKIDTLRGRGWEREPQVPVRLRSGQALDFAPDFLSGFVVSVNIMRLSLRKAAYVIVDENGVVGNPEFAPNEQKIKPIESISISSVHFSLNLPQASQFLGMTQVGAGADLVPRLRRSDHLRHRFPSPSWLGSRFASMAILQSHFSFNLPQASRLLLMKNRRLGR